MKKILFSLLIVVGLWAMCGFSRLGSNTHPLSFSGSPKTKEQLGEALFFEKILSADSSRSCSSCHIPECAFADTLPFSLGVYNRKGKRNAPSCANMADRPYFFYDGRAATLEEQVKFPIEDFNEMNTTIVEVVHRLNNNKQYLGWFSHVFSEKPTVQNLESAIASFERTLETSKTPFDRYMVNEDSTLVDASVLRGREIFMKKGKCFECHFTPDFTGDEFRNIGLFDGHKFNDSGRFVITRNPDDIGKFKVPGLRNVAATAPYMHNGMFKTLREVIDYYDHPERTVAHPINLDTVMAKPIHLSDQDKTDLESFLISLTDDRFKSRIGK